MNSFSSVCVLHTMSTQETSIEVNCFEMEGMNPEDTTETIIHVHSYSYIILRSWCTLEHNTLVEFACVVITFQGQDGVAPTWGATSAHQNLDTFRVPENALLGQKCGISSPLIPKCPANSRL